MTDPTSQRFRRVLDHIDRHLGGNLSLDALADVAFYSRHHFHRRFAALTGVSLHRYVQLTRFKRAAWQAAFRSDVSLLEIALDAGYDSAEAFSRAFRQRLGQSPSAFREAPDWRVWATAWHELDDVRRFHMPETQRMDDVRIVDFPATAVACLSHVGPPERVGESIRRFIAWRKAHGLSPAKSATWNVLYYDPDTTPPEDYRIDLCVSCIEPPGDGEGVDAALLEGGRCAVLRHTGSDALLGDAIRFLYGDWLSVSGEEPRDAPLFLQRIAFFPDVPEHEAITDIFLPLSPQR